MQFNTTFVNIDEISKLETLVETINNTFKSSLWISYKSYSICIGS